MTRPGLQFRGFPLDIHTNNHPVIAEQLIASYIKLFILSSPQAETGIWGAGEK